MRKRNEEGFSFINSFFHFSPFLFPDDNDDDVLVVVDVLVVPVVDGFNSCVCCSLLLCVFLWVALFRFDRLLPGFTTLSLPPPLATSLASDKNV